MLCEYNHTVFSTALGYLSYRYVRMRNFRFLRVILKLSHLQEHEKHCLKSVLKFYYVLVSVTMSPTSSITRFTQLEPKPTDLLMLHLSFRMSGLRAQVPKSFSSCPFTSFLINKRPLTYQLNYFFPSSTFFFFVK